MSQRLSTYALFRNYYITEKIYHCLIINIGDRVTHKNSKEVKSNVIYGYDIVAYKGSKEVKSNVLYGYNIVAYKGSKKVKSYLIRS